MANFDLPYFGELELSSLNDSYDSIIQVNEKPANIDLNFDIADIKITPELMDKLKSNILNLGNRDKTNLSIIKNDFDSKDGEVVRSYLEHHLDDFEEDELKMLVDTRTSREEQVLQLYNKITLYRIGYYLDRSKMNITYDYTIGKEFTDYLIVINTDLDENLIYITMES